jgi:acyl-CoA synthetase (NDP forming)
MPEHPLDFIFYPKSVAVVGASENPMSFGYDYLRHLIDYGYPGTIYPINPKRSELFGLKVYPEIGQLPNSVDYVIAGVPISRIPDLLTEGSKKGVKGVHIVASGASETGHKEAVELDKEILQRARNYGIRLIGPNCLGIYCPEAGLSTGYDFPKASGPVSGLFQSGGNSTDFIRWGSLKGLRFSKVVSYGNALDLDEADFLNYYSQDNKTKVILCYIEGVKDGKAFLGALRNAARLKPVIIIRAGLTKAGLRAVVSHTGALASSTHVWDAAVKQAGAIPASNIDEMIDLAIPFCLLPPIKGTRVGIEGGSGGKSAVAADECERMGFDIIPLPSGLIEKVRSIDPANLEKVTNPADPSNLIGSPLQYSVISLMAKDPDFDFLIGMMTEDAPMSERGHIENVRKQLGVLISVAKEGLKPVIVILGDRSLGTAEMNNWRWKLYAEVRTELINAGVPFFHNVCQVAKAMKEFTAYYRKKEDER